MPYTPGPFDSEHIYLQWGGKLPGSEQWSNGLRFYGPAGGAAAAAVAMLPNVAAAIVAFHGRAESKIRADAKLSFVKLNGIDVNGHYIGDGTNQALYADIPGAGGTSPVYPNQVAWAVTFTTGYSRGPAHKGRIYMPLPTASVDATGVVAAIDATTLSGSVDTLQTALNAVNADWKLGVFSRKSGAAGHRAITGNLVGRVLDTQRRRRRKLVEDYR